MSNGKKSLFIILGLIILGSVLGKNKSGDRAESASSSGGTRADCLEAAKAALEALEASNGGSNPNFTKMYKDMVSNCPKK
jgi:hypothetical protein